MKFGRILVSERLKQSDISMIDDLISIALRIFVQIILWLLFFPIFFVVATPFILVGAFFGKSSFRENVVRSYRKVFDLWKKSSWLYPSVL